MKMLIVDLPKKESGVTDALTEYLKANCGAVEVGYPTKSKLYLEPELVLKLFATFKKFKSFCTYVPSYGEKPKRPGVPSYNQKPTRIYKADIELNSLPIQYQAAFIFNTTVKDCSSSSIELHRRAQKAGAIVYMEEAGKLKVVLDQKGNYSPI